MRSKLIDLKIAYELVYKYLKENKKNMTEEHLVETLQVIFYIDNQIKKIKTNNPDKTQVN